MFDDVEDGEFDQITAAQLAADSGVEQHQIA